MTADRPVNVTAWCTCTGDVPARDCTLHAQPSTHTGMEARMHEITARIADTLIDAGHEQLGERVLDSVMSASEALDQAGMHYATVQLHVGGWRADCMNRTCRPLPLVARTTWASAQAHAVAHVRPRV